MCDGTLLPHCGHLFSCETCQRFAALRMRIRIFDVLRFGTPMAGAYKSIFRRNYNQRLCDSLTVRALDIEGPLQRFSASTFELQLVQRAPIRFPFSIPVFGFDLFGFAKSITVSVAMRMCR